METSTKVLVATGAVALTAAVAASGALKSTGVGKMAEPPTDNEAARFLTQATWGATEADIATVKEMGIEAWLDDQISLGQLPRTDQYSTKNYILERTSSNKNPFFPEARVAFQESFYTRVAQGQDQLRQRMQSALSQIFVVSRTADVLEFGAWKATAQYYDMLGFNALGNFRRLLEEVTLSPAMGMYLTHVQSQKEDPATGRHPDENYAREVMQLMTIGTVMLNEDGTPQLRNGAPIPAYSHDDVEGLAKVFSGLSWAVGSFFSALGNNGGYEHPLKYYPEHHSTSEKKFLGVTIPASTTSNGPRDLAIALDTLFQHPNVGPFIGRQLIQRFVTSNPSPDYVARVAKVFNDNGQGVRGELSDVIKAILLDPEARDLEAAQRDENFGKLREPLLRLTSWMRAFKAYSKTGFFIIHRDGLGDESRIMMGTSLPLQLGQAPLTAPSVFNFWRPGYSPPNTPLGEAGLVAPELQIVSELTAASYFNFIKTTIDTGVGYNPKTWSMGDVVSQYRDEVALAATPEALLDRVNSLLFYGQMSAALRQQILAAVNSIAIPATNETNIDAAKLKRAKLAVFLSMVSGEYLVQR
ncbi:DUF1800 domain-containing protein [Caulobacter sp. NIBR2454]|uniref:DUF1800 domain-containing protein n=1 Tax=Caulobacter sp. NIBR2454 TaxID=3015996 RepID=UPI0022B66FE7|nr:DUF1800 domain-containing protein [Caulobacter sp. NIBR2454]